jgi:hypothetical protein
MLSSFLSTRKTEVYGKNEKEKQNTSTSFQKKENWKKKGLFTFLQQGSKERDSGQSVITGLKFTRIIIMKTIWKLLNTVLNK